MPNVNPDILLWARTTAGLTREQAVEGLRIRDARGVPAVQRLTEYETGGAAPTRPMLVRMAQHYRRPLLTFFLPVPPRSNKRGVDFRGRPDNSRFDDSAGVDALLRDVRARQSMIRAVLEDEDEAQPLPFVGAATMAAGKKVALASLHALLGVDRSHFRARSDAGAAFRLLRTQAEAAGIFVLLKGDLGSYHTAIDVQAFRGFVIADKVAPLIVINDGDAKPAWSFTLLHEMVHLLHGQTGISGAPADTPVERFCNDIAGEFLLAADELDGLDLRKAGDVKKAANLIGEFALHRHLSRAMVAYVALRHGLIDTELYRHLAALFRGQWVWERRNRRAERMEGTGPSYYVVRRHRLGDALIQLTRRMMDTGALTTTKAARILGVKPTRVPALIDGDRS